MQNRCRGLAGFLFGHDFHDVSDVKVGEGKMPEFTELQMGIAVAHDRIPAILEAGKSRESKYVHSVCRRCGETVARPNQLFQ